MKNYFIFFVFFIFIFSCSSEKKETVDANSLIKPKFQFNDYLFECNIKENSNLINLEAFLSSFVKGPLTKDDIDTFKYMFQNLILFKHSFFIYKHLLIKTYILILLKH